jgi:outer membrane protein
MPGRNLTAIVCGINLIGLVVLFYLHFAVREKKIVYIDSAKIINSYKGMIKAREDYQAKTAIWKANIDTLAKDVQSKIAEYQKENSKMSAKEKDLSKQLIQTKQQQLTEYQRAISERAQQEDDAMTKKVMTEINAFIKGYGETHHYTIVLAATEQGNIAFAEKELDITEQIIEGLNKAYGGVPAEK